MGQVLPPDSLVVQYTRPMDPESVCALLVRPLWRVPRGWVARLNKDISLAVLQLATTRRPPATRRSRIVSFLPFPQGGWRPGLAPNAITNIWAAPPLMAGAGADLVIRKVSGEWFHPPGVSRVFHHIAVSRPCALMISIHLEPVTRMKTSLNSSEKRRGRNP